MTLEVALHPFIDIVELYQEEVLTLFDLDAFEVERYLIKFLNEMLLVMQVFRFKFLVDELVHVFCAK